MRPPPTIEHYMTRAPHTIEPSAPLSAAHKKMREFQIRHLPVETGGALVGIVSVGDLHLLETLKDVDIENVPVSDAMSRDVYVVAPRAPLDDVAAKMAAKKVGSAVVVEDSLVVGVFTTIDALIALLSIYKRPVP